MGNAWKAGVCLGVLAALAAGEAEAARRPALKCAQPSEVAAIQTTVVDQQLVDAALTCGDATREGFNAYRTAFGAELRGTDKLLLSMFKRVYGGSRGDAAYNLFKTDMASKAELRRVHNVANFCQAADLVLAAANAPVKPALRDFRRRRAGRRERDAGQFLRGEGRSDLPGRPGRSGDPPDAQAAAAGRRADRARRRRAAARAGRHQGRQPDLQRVERFGMFFGSSKDLKCTYAPNGGSGEHYTGTFSKYGLDIGYADNATLVWGVVAPSSDVRPGALEGDYAGATAGATLVVGLGANVLIGGLDKSIALQPVSVQGNTGLNIAAGVGVITLKYEQ